MSGVSLQVDPTVNDRAAASSAPARSNGRRLLLAFAPLIGVVVFLGLWQLLVVAFDVRPFVLPKPSRILSHINSDKTYYWENARTTMWEAFLGFVVALAAALVVAAVMAHSRFADRAISPLLILIQVTPIVAYAPAIVLWVGFDLKPIVIITSIACFVPFVVNAVTGFRSVDPNLIELARSVNASRLEVFTRLRFPSALPSLFSAARIAVGLALIGAVLGEWFGGVNHGLGYSVRSAQQQGNRLSDQLWGSIYVLALIGGVAIIAIGLIERVVLHWHASQRN